MKILIAIFLSLSLGFFLGRQTAPEKKIEGTQLSPEMKKKIEDIGTKEMMAYAMAEDAKAKLKAADDLYGKVVLLFLADLQLRLDIPQVPKETVWVTPTPEATVVEKPFEPGSDPSPLAALKSVSQKFKDSSENLEEVASIGNKPKLIERYKQSSFATKFTPKLRRIMGEHRGTIKFVSGKYNKQTHTIITNFDFQISGKSLSGQALVEISDKNGVAYSTSRGNGGNNSIRISKDNPNLIFIDCSPNSFFSLFLDSYPYKGYFYHENTYRGNVTLRK